ncbi:hypothetical protein [uncultured Deinococcus sp.]|uniref:hypothetical protein n=1 Tax=uncultured Deinococcus sp. TaxID=158789 RepID=UPI0025FF4BAF|nr:hypothetical protein [uncultured Deinococcus sp.]
MTLTGPTSTLDQDAALEHLRDALGANYGGPTDTPTLERALGVDAVTVEGTVHPRPWATAARLIRDNTEYEVSKGLSARIDRKLQGLDAQQARADTTAGIQVLDPSDDRWPPRSGVVDTQAVF